jgi:hypothetical protein
MILIWVWLDVVGLVGCSPGYVLGTIPFYCAMRVSFLQFMIGDIADRWMDMEALDSER